VRLFLDQMFRVELAERLQRPQHARLAPVFEPAQQREPPRRGFGGAFPEEFVSDRPQVLAGVVKVQFHFEPVS